MNKIYISTRPDPIRKRRSQRALRIMNGRAKNEATKDLLDRVFPNIEPYRQRRRAHLSLFLWLGIPTWVLFSLAQPWFWVPGFFIIWMIGSVWA